MRVRRRVVIEANALLTGRPGFSLQLHGKTRRAFRFPGAAPKRQDGADMSSRRFREDVLHEFSACGQRGRWTRGNRPARIGEPMRAMRAVREFIRAGIAGIHIEDQLCPKRAHYHKYAGHAGPAGSSSTRSGWRAASGTRG